MPLTSSVMGQMMARFRNFYSLQKVKIWLKKGVKKLNAFPTGAKIYLSEKKSGVTKLHFPHESYKN